MSNQRQLQAAATRRHLLDTALALVGEQGFESLSVSTLTQAAGVTKGALFHHFESMEALGYAALEQLMADSFAAIGDTLPPTLQDYLDAFEHALFDQTFAHPNTARALFSFVRVGMFRDRYRQLLSSMLQQGCEKFARDLGHYCGDRIDEEQLATLGRLLDAIVGGLGVHWFTFEQHARTRRDWRCFRNMITQQIS